MDRKLVSPVFILILLWGITACSSKAALPTSTVSIPTATILTNQNSLPAGCQPEESLLNNMEAQLPYDLKVILYQAYQGEHSLLVWFVEPELGIEYNAENEDKAVTKAVEAAQILIDSSVCVEKFDLLHITVVSMDYTQWFSGSIRPTDIPLDGEPGTGGSPEEERGAGVFEVTAGPLPLPGPDACDWKAASENLDVQFNELDLVADFYYIRDSYGSIVYVHWVSAEIAEAVEKIPYLESVVEQIACLYPKPTGISLSVSGKDGVMLLTGYMPGMQSGEDLIFRLEDFSYQLVEP